MTHGFGRELAVDFDDDNLASPANTLQSMSVTAKDN
jgi:hypothetical protein